MPEPTRPPLPRIAAIDLARGIALLAMASYHLTWDLEFFGYVPPGMTAMGGWKLYARCIAGTFLFLAGVSLALAHGGGIRWAKFWRRWAPIALAALAISGVSVWFSPGSPIFFGILHQIAFASLFGLAFLRAPALLTIAVAALVIALPNLVRLPAFDPWPLWWVGLSTVPLHSNDYVPVFPWTGLVLLGIAACRLARRGGWLERFALLPTGRWSRPLRFIGRHSLIFYLVHQPALIVLVWLASHAVPVSHERFAGNQRVACEANCAREGFDAPFCAAYCGCLVDRLDAGGRLTPGFPASEADRATLEQTKAACYADAEADEPGDAKP